MNISKYITLSILSSISALSFSEAPGVHEKDYGLYIQRVEHDINYYVDTVTQLCFVLHNSKGGATPINCNNLYKRDEWKEYISWVDNSYNKSIQPTAKASAD